MCVCVTRKAADEREAQRKEMTVFKLVSNADSEDAVCSVQDQRVGEPEDHRSSPRQSAGPAV